MADLVPVITTAGLGAVWRAQNDGVSAQITHVALGDGAYAPSQDAVGLRSERARYAVAGGARVSDRQIHLTALADGAAEFWVREVGFVLSDGTMLAVWSDAEKPLAYKAPGVELLLAYDLTLHALPASSVTIAPSSLGLNLAMSRELAALAAAQIDGMTRSLLNLWRIDRIEAAHAATAARLAELTSQPAGQRWWGETAVAIVIE